MMELLAPKVLIMMSTAITAAPAAPRMLSATAVPTRSLAAYMMPRASTSVSGALGLPCRGSTSRYTRLMSRYRAVTMPVPIAMLSTMVRSGRTISSPEKPMLFQASELNREPVMPSPMAATRPHTVSGVAWPWAS